MASKTMNWLYGLLVKRYVKTERVGVALVVTIETEQWNPLWRLFLSLPIPENFYLKQLPAPSESSISLDSRP